jgi:hypothetical protein
VAFCQPLNVEDYGLQADAFVSPPKWHLAHTSWFFETFLLKPFLDGYVSPDERYEMLFNSYYNGVGEQFPRPRRGLLSRPGVAQVMDYRERVDHAMSQLLAADGHPAADDILMRTVLGVEHERQHQELFFTDIKYSLAVNPLHPTFVEATLADDLPLTPLRWYRYEGGLVHTGFDGEGF